MGTLLIILMKIFQSVWRHVGFILHYKKNMKNLEDAVNKLEKQRNNVKGKVNEAYRKNEAIDNNVSVWLKDADETKQGVDKFRDEKTVKENMFFNFSCPNFIWRYRLSKEAEKKVVHVKHLTDESGKFGTVSREWQTSQCVPVKKSNYINAAFRSSRTDEAYLFMKDEYLRLDYAPGTSNDKVLNGPQRISNGFPSLKNTAFAEPGIDCAFGSHHGDEAFIFSGSLCARINYAPGTTNDKIIEGPMTIIQMFPFFKGTVFESGVDSAFESTISDEAYLFRGNRYALINYKDPRLIIILHITIGFVSLKGTIFESGIEAAFASHRANEAYLFKGDTYARINFAPHTTNDYIIGGVKKILPNWPSLQGILPRKN